MIARKKYKWIFILFLFSLGVCFFSYFLFNHKEEAKEHKVDIKLKIVNTEGRVLSGFLVSDSLENLGRTDSFGEWHFLYVSKTLDPFFLNLKSYHYENELSKRVKVTFENKKGSVYFFNEVIKFPTKKNNFNSNLSFSERAFLRAEETRKSLEKIYFNFEDSAKSSQNFFNKEKLEIALQKEAFLSGFEYTFDSKWQALIESYFRKGKGKFLRVVVKLPFDEKRLIFFVRMKGSEKAIARSILFKLREKIHYPYLVKRLGGKWFASAAKSDQKGFWALKPRIFLKSPVGDVSVTKHKKIKGDDILFSLWPVKGDLCQSPEEESCYLPRLPKK